ncbi:hypothetical protein PVAND_002290 [Polypedilum vanderplanki]|uniref:TrmE-type G domain-containing protein n=1 Tax=Polypedilum vanderplanki TaxID=319348 RepID=A0A9J6BQZ8_POLVA|nr:hypothetical protein PVAND_002290 [Polypedilum vanderplanki]
MIIKRLIGLRYISNYTIFNKSSGHGKSGIAVIRVSGSKTKEALRALTGTDNYKPRYATLKQIKDPITKELIDNGICIYFEGQKSFTGEDSCEFQVHGGPSIVSALLRALGKIEGMRLSYAGEFAKRAFLNGKINLLEAEALADLIHAETDMQRKQALIQADGHLSKLYQKWRTKFIRNIAHVEAYVDFSEDDNIESDILISVKKELQELEEEIHSHLSDGRKGERLRDGVRLAIVGSPNVGKSSLMNLLVRRDISIVTDIEGTTRDVIESTFDLNGYPVIISDTAGLRESSDIVESEGIRRAKNCASRADLIILLIDGSKMEKDLCGKSINFEQYRTTYLNQLGLTDEIINFKRLMTVVNKIDLMSEKGRREIEESSSDVLGISCSQNIKVSSLVDEITNHLVELCGSPSTECPYLSQERHRFYLQECLKHLTAFLIEFDPKKEQDLSILVQNVRNCVRSIGKITGEVRTDEILDVIFKDFCIGK